MVVSQDKEAHLFSTHVLGVWDPGVGTVMCVCVGGDKVMVGALSETVERT